MNVNDGNPETYWSAPDDTRSASLTIDLGTETEVEQDTASGIYQAGTACQEFKVEAFVEGEWKLLMRRDNNRIQSDP